MKSNRKRSGRRRRQETPPPIELPTPEEATTQPGPGPVEHPEAPSEAGDAAEQGLSDLSLLFSDLGEQGKLRLTGEPDGEPGSALPTGHITETDGSDATGVQADGTGNRGSRQPDADRAPLPPGQARGENREAVAESRSAKKEILSAKPKATQAQPERHPPPKDPTPGEPEANPTAGKKGDSDPAKPASENLRQIHDRLQLQIQALEIEVASARISRFEALEAELANERENRRGALARELAALRTSAEEDVKVKLAELAERRRTLDEEAKSVGEKQRKTAKALDAREEALLAKERGLTIRERDLRLDTQMMEQDRGAIEERTKFLADDEIKVLQAQLSAGRKQTDRLIEARTKLEERLSQLQDVFRKIGDDPKLILKRQQELEHEIDDLKEDLASRPSSRVEAQLKALRQEKKSWKAERDRLIGTKEEQDQQILELLYSASQVETLRAELDLAKHAKNVAQTSRKAAESQTAVLDDKVAKLQALHEQPQALQARLGAIEEPLFDADALKRDRGRKEFTELKWLSEIHGQCVASGLSFDERILHAFHTSLKTSEWSPLTVLAGVSGTGKSELPRLYSRFGGLLFRSLPVQPDWDSPRALFGFYNTMEHRFKATELLRAMVQTQKSPKDPDYRHGCDDCILLVLFDEMNLAHVELYFSDLLSKLEQRRGVVDVPCLSLDLGAGADPYQLSLGTNVIWTGTMNEDETTKALSDKVLDRGNVISFPRPRQLHRRPKARLAEPRRLLPHAKWSGWIVSESTFEDADLRDYKSLIEHINTHLGNVGRALGHRVWQAIEQYMANYPTVKATREGDPTHDLTTEMKKAFEDQLAQKVMPKLRGIETTGDALNDCLIPIQQSIENFGLPGLGADFRQAISTGYGAFVWNQASYLERSG